MQVLHAPHYGVPGASLPCTARRIVLLAAACGLALPMPPPPRYVTDVFDRYTLDTRTPIFHRGMSVPSGVPQLAKVTNGVPQHPTPDTW